MIKKFNQFIKESNFPTSKEEIDLLCKKYGIVNYSINSDLSIDVQGGVYLNNLTLKSLPLRFSRVSGHFSCYNNQLTTLEGCPREVGGDFYCHSNLLTTLEGGPNEVGGYFYCFSNLLTTLKGGPIEVGGDFDGSSNRLTSLEGCPREVGGDFSCHYNPVSEIIDIFPDYKMVLKVWDDFDVVRNGNDVSAYRFGEMYLDITGERFKGVLKFKNYKVVE